jgi:8-oxo-dGTP pyrophosphatase MutT (NUDIX family)
MAAELPPSGPGHPLLAELDAASRRHAGPAVKARQAASVILVRDRLPASAGSGDQDDAPPGEVELLLVKRNPEARFMGGVWVFPGGAVDSAEGHGDRAHRAAAVRELAEEAGVEGIDPASLVKFSRWITPAELAVRFDTHFFIARLPDEAPGPRVDGHECVELAWLTAQDALDAHADGRILLVFPTIRQLEQLRGFTTVDALIDHARDRRVTPARPRVILADGSRRVVMPGEPGYDRV